MKHQFSKPKTNSIVVTPNDGVIQLFVGPMPRGPKHCIKCGKEFKNGEAWRRMTSPNDPQYGSYSIGIHEKCNDK